jgi:hypothetical protein
LTTLYRGDGPGPAWVEPREIMEAMRAALVRAGFAKQRTQRYWHSDEVVWTVGLHRVFNGSEVGLEVAGCLRGLAGTTELPPPDSDFQITALYDRPGREVPYFASDLFADTRHFLGHVLTADSRLPDDFRAEAIECIAQDLAAFAQELSTQTAVLEAARTGRLLGTFSRAVNALLVPDP